MKPRIPLEREVQASVVSLYRLCGASVYSTSQGYRRDRGGTRMTPGIPDLYVLHPRLGGFWHETKRKGGKLRASQQGFIREAVACDVPVVVGGLEEAKAFLRAHGLLATPGQDRRIRAAKGSPSREPRPDGSEGGSEGVRGSRARWTPF